MGGAERREAGRRERVGGGGRAARVTEKYFMDVQQACIAFYEHDDVVVQVRAGVVCEVDVRVRAAQPAVRVRAVQRLVLRRERGAADRRLDSERR